MRITFRDLWNWKGRLNRGSYALIGVAGIAIKVVLDRILAVYVLHEAWDFFSYWTPIREAGHITSLSRHDVLFLAIMLAVALPFIWVGVVCTLKRLHDANLPSGTVLLFFLPVLNLVLFALLCTFPSRPDRALDATTFSRPSSYGIGRFVPAGKAGSALTAVVLTGSLGCALAVLGTDWLVHYGWGLFVALPFCMGFISVLLFNFHGSKGFGNSIAVSILSSFFAGALLLVLAREGAICLILVLPLVTLLAMAGGTVAYVTRPHQSRPRANPALLSIVLVLAPAVMGVEQAVQPVPPVYQVKSEIEVEASPATVWRQVIAFTEIPQPREWIFRAGIAYPIRAEILGSGPGAERHCIFSTGAFVEPIQVWDEPNLLRFSVTSNPPPMEEWTPYAKIDTPHLHGFLVSQGGQFLLTVLPGNRTRLEGTTWYRHTLWPAAYWRVWSDYIIHMIHMRVLEHIKKAAELGTLASN
ncbi:MAG TPA: DUF805 domain-containing protein [Candidatus Acidoferrales bacterium]|nr:DUF805 domain-containing protein [Candidatus Acidoferrales bacterium]